MLRICGYEMFRILTETDQDRPKGAKPKVVKSKAAKELAKLKQDFQGFLQNPGTLDTLFYTNDRQLQDPTWLYATKRTS